MKPANIILIQSDQHRRDWLGAAGADFIHTPNLDRLASNGVRFAQCSCSYPLCGPSRMSFLTGRHPFRNGVYTNEDSLASHIPTYAHMLGVQGYLTVLCGRMHFSGPDQRHGFHERIFGDFNPSYTGGPHAELTPEMRQATVGRVACVEHAGTMESTYFLEFDEGVTRSAVAFLGQHAAQGNEAKPLFLNVGMFCPHSPLNAPKKYVDRARERAASMPAPTPTRKDLNGSEKAFHQNQQTEHLAPEDYAEMRIQYAALIDYVDERVGRIVEAARALKGPTLVIYHSDHGELAGDHGIVNKGNLDEASISTPMIWSWLDEAASPDEPARGRVVEAPVSLLDLAPTLADFAGLESPPPMDGVSLRPFMRVNGEEPDHLVFAEVAIPLKDYMPARMVRDGNFKYTYHHGHPDTFFDLASDPDELDNRIDDPRYADIIARLRKAALHEWDPERALRDAQTGWKQRAIMWQWGEKVGRELWGPMDAWMGRAEARSHSENC